MNFDPTCFPDPCASVTCTTGFTCVSGSCLCGGVSCGTTANVCNAGVCECGSVGAACTTGGIQPACYNTAGAVTAGDTTATCWVLCIIICSLDMIF